MNIEIHLLILQVLIMYSHFGLNSHNVSHIRTIALFTSKSNYFVLKNKIFSSKVLIKSLCLKNIVNFFTLFLCRIISISLERHKLTNDVQRPVILSTIDIKVRHRTYRVYVIPA